MKESVQRLQHSLVHPPLQYKAEYYSLIKRTRHGYAIAQHVARAVATVARWTRGGRRDQRMAMQRRGQQQEQRWTGSKQGDAKLRQRRGDGTGTATELKGKEGSGNTERQPRQATKAAVATVVEVTKARGLQRAQWRWRRWKCGPKCRGGAAKSSGGGRRQRGREQRAAARTDGRGSGLPQRRT